ncbi:TonB-dependent receptor [Aliikangiella sp. G2MR2-5]|uniref:TonB-dependent receptor n=1 Tax=Aliikangiella sp. G2MR2-5 TaxID=2788943 RepID=UPI0018AA1E87|nr:TonB-dependent receptor [Aliikangiella sp. G2MR2-5]
MCKKTVIHSKVVFLLATILSFTVHAQGESGAEQATSDLMPDSAAPVVVVTGTRHEKDDALINDFVSIDEVAKAPNSVVKLLDNQPGLAANGQPGLFQTINIRGLARQRVQAYISGMRITSERRAGIAASFVDPALLSGAEVTQGPASTYYGSGAIAGTIHLQTRQEDRPWMMLGYHADGNEWVTAGGTGDDTYSINLAYRTRDNGETVTGTPKNNQFSQHSLNFVRHFELGNYNLDWQVIESQGRDIGKDNLRFPESRITSYPEENHLLSQLTLSSDASWFARLYFHDQDLVTQDIRPENRINRVTTNSLDIGFSLEDSWQQGDWKGIYGVEYFGRRGVDSVEEEIDIATRASQSYWALESGEENESALFATINREFNSWSFHSGIRINYLSQKSDISESLSDSYTTYFSTLKKQLGDWELGVSYGTGFRFATVSERLFNGTTARGQVLGNPDLLPEESESLDLSVSYAGESLKFEAHGFNTDIENFIERISIDDDTRTFRNITDGKISGWQYKSEYIASNSISLVLAGQGISGHDADGNWLADIPAERNSLSLLYQPDNWITQLSYVKRSAKSKAGDGEVPLDAADIIDFKLGYRINPDWRIQFVIENLLDEAYFSSADDLATQATGRNFGLSIFYR